MKQEPNENRGSIEVRAAIVIAQLSILIVLAILLVGMVVLGRITSSNWEYMSHSWIAEVPKENRATENKEALSFRSVPDMTYDLNKLGEDGWELVELFLEMETTHPNFGDDKLVTGIQPNVRPQRVVGIFKRKTK